MTTPEPTSSADLEERFKALMTSQIPATDDGGVSIPEYHELNREMYVLLKDALSELASLRADLEHTRQIVGAARSDFERIRGMSERPTCLCGRPTGTEALKLAAQAALKRLDAVEKP